MMTKTNCLNDDNTSKMSLSSFKRPKILKRQWIIFFTVADCFLMFLLRFNLRYLNFSFNFVLFNLIKLIIKMILNLKCGNHLNIK